MQHLEDIYITRREREILLKLCLGYTAKEIGSQLYIATGTVEKHKRNLLLKTSARNTVDLAVKAIYHGLVKMPENWA
ncbi:MAG TPA: LuxR C-terminal-related transcriptional regulator [Saprospiraceae bacterium]|nr:response regulator transcription factor [Saprospiraceae bacterium]HPE10388.1 LuxR C-terminal-related transcriptional regulator [Saprospiraceae bacterium]HRX29662.1 LuxR C-terminal-related transcriptional regulator [Saprospiraceae bacterium]